MFKKLFGLLKNSLLYSTQDILEKAIGLLLIPVYTAFLTPDEYGIIALMTMVISILSIFYVSGQHGAAVRFYYEHKDSKERQEIYLGNIYLYLIIIPLILSIILTFWGNAIFDKLFTEVVFLPYGLIAVFSAYFAAIPALLLSFWIASESPKKYVAFSVGKFILRISLVILFIVVFKWGAYGKLLGGAIAGGVFWLLAIIILLRHVKINIMLNDLKHSLNFGIPLIPHLLAGMILTVSDRYMLEYFTDLTQVGLYSLGYTLGSIMLFIAVAFEKSWSPFFFSLADDQKANTIFSKVATYFFSFSIFITFLLALFAREIIVLLAAKEYFLAYRVIPVVALGVMFKCFYFIPIKALFYYKKTKIIPLITGIAAIANILLNIWLIPLYGIMGAAWATAGGYLIMFIIVLWISQKMYYIDYEKKRLLHGALVIAGFYMINRLLFNLDYFIYANIPSAIAIKSVIVLTCIIVLFFIKFINKKEILMLKNAILNR